MENLTKIVQEKLDHKILRRLYALQTRFERKANASIANRLETILGDHLEIQLVNCLDDEIDMDLMTKLII